MTMTEEELERRARKLCEMRGMDPDEVAGGGFWSHIHWKLAADELRAWDQCRRVMEEESMPERALQRGDRVRLRIGGLGGNILATATKSDGSPLALVEWDSGDCSVWSVGNLERIS